MSDHVCGPGEVCGPGWEGVLFPWTPRTAEGRADGFAWYARVRASRRLFVVALCPEAHPDRLLWGGPSPEGFSYDEPTDGLDRPYWMDDAVMRAFIARGVAAFRRWLPSVGPDVLARLPLAAAVRVQEMQREARDG